jgi:hypothetical protein
VRYRSRAGERAGEAGQDRAISLQPDSIQTTPAHRAPVGAYFIYISGQSSERGDVACVCEQSPLGTTKEFREACALDLKAPAL